MYPVLLGDLGSVRQHHVHPPGTDVAQPRPEMSHQTLTVEAGPDSLLDVINRRFITVGRGHPAAPS